jgi:hypothetical protein
MPRHPLVGGLFLAFLDKYRYESSNKTAASVKKQAQKVENRNIGLSF